jgi:transcription elongation factor Elf1
MLNAMAERGQQFAMISCANCQQSFPVNPTTLSAPSPDNEPPLPCPACADGLVSLIENSEQTFWGCGACGNVWHARPSLTT